MHKYELPLRLTEFVCCLHLPQVCVVLTAIIKPVTSCKFTLKAELTRTDCYKLNDGIYAHLTTFCLDVEYLLTLDENCCFLLRLGKPVKIAELCRLVL